jgi:hypothetical protein
MTVIIASESMGVPEILISKCMTPIGYPSTSHSTPHVSCCSCHPPMDMPLKKILQFTLTFGA